MSQISSRPPCRAGVAPALLIAAFLAPGAASTPGRASVPDEPSPAARAATPGSSESSVTRTPPEAPVPGDSQAAPAHLPSVPFVLDHNRAIVEVEFVRADGTIRVARAWIDTGDPILSLTEPLARDLGLDPPAPNEGGRSVELSGAPPMRLGGLPLEMTGVKTRVHARATVQPGIPAEANLPVSVLRHSCVVLDYPARLLTVAPPGVLRPRGTAIPCRVHPETGLFMITAMADGEELPLGVDNGSAGTWVSDRLTTAWIGRHPDWQQATGAVGSANFFGFPFESSGTLLSLPELGLGPLRVRDVGLLGLDQGLFDWYSSKSAGPVLGFLGANVLRGFRLEIDFQNQMTYWEAGSPADTAASADSGDSGDFDIVGLTLRPGADGTYAVAGVVTRNGRPTVDGVQPGDRIVRIDTLNTSRATMGAVVDALRGTPESTRMLVLEREGERITVQATVKRLP